MKTVGYKNLEKYKKTSILVSILFAQLQNQFAS